MLHRDFREQKNALRQAIDKRKRGTQALLTAGLDYRIGAAERIKVLEKLGALQNIQWNQRCGDVTQRCAEVSSKHEQTPGSPSSLLRG
jgi:hypothetical protein